MFKIFPNYLFKIIITANLETFTPPFLFCPQPFESLNRNKKRISELNILAEFIIEALVAERLRVLFLITRSSHPCVGVGSSPALAT